MPQNQNGDAESDELVIRLFISSVLRKLEFREGNHMNDLRLTACVISVYFEFHARINSHQFTFGVDEVAAANWSI